MDFEALEFEYLTLSEMLPFSVTVGQSELRLRNQNQESSSPLVGVEFQCFLCEFSSRIHAGGFDDMRVPVSSYSFFQSAFVSFGASEFHNKGPKSFFKLFDLYNKKTVH